MKIHKLNFTNFRVLKSAEFELQGKSAIFFGINGSGKSTVIHAINIMFADILNKIVGSKFRQKCSLEQNDITVGEKYSKIQMWLTSDKMYHFEKDVENVLGKKYSSTKPKEFYGKFIENYILKEKSNMPIFASYGANRHATMQGSLKVDEKHVFDKSSAFYKAINEQIDFKTFFSWFRNQEDFENEMKIKVGIGYKDKSLESVRNSIYSMMSGFSDLKIERNPLRMTVLKNGAKQIVDFLSDGEKCMLALVGDIARRLAIANADLDNPQHGKGIVLIDEIELHMHPSWQRKILDVLKETFPNIQFIITTHSPQVLSEVNYEYSIFGLKLEKNAFDVLEIDSLDGWDVNDILETFMDTSHMNKASKGEFSKMFELIDKRNYDEAERILARLIKKTNRNNPDIINARMLIQKGRRGL